ncbi:nucleoside 2-deoxyribosyltransferase/predicted secreted protein [Methanolinea mesophila]|uniref:nucleoside 2-deoxyribosyltransferase n=1 Tax=Methanolinea mesophila TaxID=547055 RepID=UPI001AE2E0AE|nr:nucleoside 2-deoxyribosyltransferase [Methanolinea mesophila]MBP1928786.1 nucleoside 2-deoxyribosyltransferase/predicted secreted protein [Methanolinea mesophila]
MYILVCPCILDPGLRARGITTPRDLESFSRALDRCRRFGLEIVPLPCPETNYLGRDREPATFLDRLDTPEFEALLDSMEKGTREVIRERGPPFGILGVNSSPTCGVDTTYHGPGTAGSRGKKPERGVFLSRFPEIPAIDVQVFARYRIYLAAPLFSEAERDFNRKLSGILASRFFEVYLPQETGDDSCSRGLESHREIYRSHVEALRSVDAVIAVVDGADADSGTAWEMGYASARGIPVFALRTDFRMAGRCEHVNLMLEQSATVAGSIGELLSALDMPGALRPRKYSAAGHETAP